MTDDFSRTWIDYVDDLDAEALNDLEARMEARAATGSFVFDSTGAALFFPETYGAKGDGEEVHDGAITSGSNSLASVTAAFVTADIGKCCTVLGAGSGGDPLRTTISSISGGAAHLAGTASTTVSAGTVIYGTDDTVPLQAAFDAGMAASILGIDPVVKLNSAATYLAESAPDISKGGNSILYIKATGLAQLGRARIAVEGNTDWPKGNTNRPAIRTTRFEDTYWGSPTTTLSVGIDDTQTSLVVANMTGFPAKGTIALAFEIIHYTSITPGAGTTGTLNGCTRGYMQSTADTHSPGEPIKWTVGPPSVIGNCTEENNGRPTSFPFTDLISIAGIEVDLPADPAIAGIDGLGWGGMYISASVSAAGAGPPTAPPSNPWAFGIRGPTQYDFGYVNYNHATVDHMYCGFVVFHPDHAEFLNANANRCVLAIGFQVPTPNALFGGGGHAIAGGYFITENNQYDMAGWSASGGVQSIPASNDPVNFTTLTLDVEDQGAGGSPIHINGVKDANDRIFGFMTLRVVAAATNIPVWAGGRNIHVRLQGGIGTEEAANVIAPAGTFKLDPDPWDEVVKVSAGVTRFLPEAYLGRTVRMVFTQAGTVQHNGASVPDNYSPILLNSGNPFVVANNSTLTVFYDGTNWQEASRKIP